MKTPRTSHVCRDAPLGLGWASECPIPQPAKRHSVRRTVAKKTPADPRPTRSHPWRYTMGLGPSRSLGSNDRSLTQPPASGVLFLLASISGTLSLAATHLPTTQAPTAPTGPSYNPRSEINLRAQYEVIPILERPIFLNDEGPCPATIRPSTLLPEHSTAPAPRVATSFPCDLRAAATFPG